MSSQTQTPKEKYESLIKELRLQKSLSILEKIFEDLKTNKEHLYNNEIIPYKFSNDFIWFLKTNLIDKQIQMDIFKLYIEQFLNLKWNSDNLNNIQFLFDIFTFDSNFFSYTSNIDNFLGFLNRYFNLYFPKKSNEIHKEGDYMDVYITEEMNKIILSGWLQLKIKRIDIEKNLYIFEDYKDKTKEIVVAIDSFRVQEKNTFVKEEEMNWRNSELKIGDKLDFLNKKKYWAEATIKKIISENEISIETLGQPPTDEIIVNKYSPFVQPYLKYSIKYEPEYINSVNALHDNISFQRFNYVVPFTENNHLVPFDNTKFYSIEYYELTNFFINKVIETKILMNESISIEYIYMILNVLYVTLPAINHKFLGEYIEKNCLENIEKILLKLSLDKKMNKSKFVVEEIIKYLKIFYGLDHYLFQVTEYFLEFCLEFGFNCFKISENLEKRLLGLNSIFKIIGMASIDFLGYSNDQMDKKKLLIKNKLFGNEENNDLFGLLFTNPNIHDQLLLKGTEVIMLLAKIKLIDDKIVERLYNYSWRVEDDSEIHKSIFIILGDCATLMELSQQKILFNKIISLPHDKIRQKDISLISFVLRAIIDENEFKIMCEAFLDYYYKYILEYQKSNDSSYSQFALVLSYAKSEENIKYFFCHYFEKIVNDSKIQNNLDDYRYIFYFIYSIINILKEKEQKEKNITYIPAIKNQFREIFLKVYKNMEEIVDKLMDLNTKDTLDEESKELNITDIINITAKLIEFIEQKNFYSLESMKKLSEYYIFSNILRKTRNIFLIKLSGFQLYNLDKEKFFDYFFNRFNSFLDTINETNPENNKLLDDIIILNIFHIYLNLNRHSEEELPEDIDLNNYLKSLKVYTAKDNPLKYKYIDIIWKMFSKYKYCIELSQFIETFSLKNFSPSERHEIWEKLVEKIFQNIDNDTLISLQMIELIINNSEKFGSGNTKSHSIELKKKVPVKLYLHNDLSKLLPEFDFSETEEIFYSTDIIYDIKKRIQKKYGLDPIFFEIDPQKSKIYSNFYNIESKAIFQLYPGIEKRKDDEINIYFRRSKYLSLLPEYPLKTDKHLTKKFEQILREIFYKFCQDDKLDLDNYKEYFKIALRNEPTQNMEKVAIETFNVWDLKKKGYWAFEDFALFFYSSIDKKKASILLDLGNLGYTPSLDYYLAPLNQESPFYYEENNKKEFMPRYFIGNNKKYMDKLFALAKSDNKDIIEKSQKLIQELCTYEEMKKIIFENNDEIKEIFSNPNLEIRAYVFDILLAEFEKEEKDEKNKNLVDNFINNNLNNIIEELGKFSNDKDDVSLLIRYFNFYLSNLKIIFYAFKSIMGNNDIIEEIDKFETLEDDNGKNFFKITQVELNDDKINFIKKLYLEFLTNIIGKNLIIINDKSNDIYRQGIHLSITLFIYILLFTQNFPEKEKSEIYSEYIKYELLLTRIIIQKIYFLQRINLY